ncbi:hypothetical protein [Streptomyces sp. 900105245]
MTTKSFSNNTPFHAKITFIDASGASQETDLPSGQSVSLDSTGNDLNIKLYNTEKSAVVHDLDSANLRFLQELVSASSAVIIIIADDGTVSLVGSPPGAASP